MKHTLAHLVALLLAQFGTSHAATPGADKTKLDIIYKTKAQGPLRLDLQKSSEGSGWLFV